MKNKFYEIFSIENRRADCKIYNMVLNEIEEVIKKNEGHSELNYVEEVYFNQETKEFEIDIYITNEESAEHGIFNEDVPDVKYYSIDKVIELLNINNKGNILDNIEANQSINI